MAAAVTDLNSAADRNDADGLLSYVSGRVHKFTGSKLGGVTSCELAACSRPQNTESHLDQLKELVQNIHF